MTEEQIFNAEAHRLNTLGQDFVLHLDISHAISLICQVQLAARHPGNCGDTRKQGERVVRALQELIEDVSPELARILEKGWHPVFDLTTPGGRSDGR